MGPKLSNKHLQLALEFVAINFVDLEYFIFYGTLLGICRTGTPIDGDDDIDIMVPRGRREELLGLLLSHESILYDKNSSLNQTPYFLQVSIKFDGIDVPIDFYFFDECNGFILEKWTKDAWSNGMKPLSIPIELVYPLSTISIAEKFIKCPLYPESCCQFIYGPRWRIPRKKNTEYETYLENGILKLRRPTLNTRLSFLFPYLQKIRILRKLVNYFRL